MVLIILAVWRFDRSDGGYERDFADHLCDCGGTAYLRQIQRRPSLKRQIFQFISKGSVSEKTVNELTDKIKKLDNVTGVTYISAEQARHEQTQRYKDNVEALEAIREASNELPATLQVSVKDLNNYSSLKHFVGTDKTYLANKDQRRQPSFTGDRRQAIETIGGWVRVASIGGSIATVVFVLISSLVVFNTIRMAIFNRRARSDDEAHRC